MPFNSYNDKFGRLIIHFWINLSLISMNAIQEISYTNRIMIEKRSGLIVNISSFGGLKYLFNVPYGVGKAALDRMTQDTAVELKKHNVAVIGVWPGPVKTEAVSEKILGNSGSIKI